MKKFYKSRMNKKICGVCGGIAAALEVDAIIIRAIFLASVFYSMGTAILVYFIAAFCLDVNDNELIVPNMYRSRENKKIFGVCGGIAEYFEMDAFILRMLFVFVTLFFGFGFFTYIILALMLPKKNF